MHLSIQTEAWFSLFIVLIYVIKLNGKLVLSFFSLALIYIFIYGDYIFFLSAKIDIYIYETEYQRY